MASKSDSWEAETKKSVAKGVDLKVEYRPQGASVLLLALVFTTSLPLFLPIPSTSRHTPPAPTIIKAHQLVASSSSVNVLLTRLLLTCGYKCLEVFFPIGKNSRHFLSSFFCNCLACVCLCVRCKWFCSTIYCSRPSELINITRFHLLALQSTQLDRLCSRDYLDFHFFGPFFPQQQVTLPLVSVAILNGVS